ncbi:MAG: RNA ligase (ATP) [Blastopirellula sp.]|nr:MAG: RNA ligase (ATP) [Blastopirellula sp.]
MRKLASIQLIQRLEPIKGADAIERARVLGWWVVVKKGQFQVGDAVVYCEIDSLLPEREEFEFLRSGSFKPAIVEGDSEIRRAGFRIKTAKLRGQVSQGICFSLDILPDDVSRVVGTDLTELLDIEKYEPPIPVGMTGRIKGDFPSFLTKTDETRVQLLEEALERHQGATFYVTEKLDGTSFTAFLREGEFGICSRNQWLDESDDSNTLVKISRALQLEEKLKQIQKDFGFQPAIQAEVIGPGVQKNKYGLTAHELRVFNVFNIDEFQLVDHALLLKILDAVNLDGVPQLDCLVLNHSVDDLIQLSAGVSQLNSKVQREGIVIRPMVEQHEPTIGGRLSFKAINPKFLLKYDE